MNKWLYYFFAGPLIAFGSVVELIVWEIFSDGRWKQRKVPSNPAIHWQNEAIAARRQLREFTEKSRRQQEEQKKRKK
jgi:hypothetical protein